MSQFNERYAYHANTDAIQHARRAIAGEDRFPAFTEHGEIAPAAWSFLPGVERQQAIRLIFAQRNRRSVELGESHGGCFKGRVAGWIEPDLFHITYFLVY